MPSLIDLLLVRIQFLLFKKRQGNTFLYNRELQLKKEFSLGVNWKLPVSTPLRTE